MFFASPEKQQAGKRFKMSTSEIDIKSGPLEDVYVALVSFNPNRNRAAFKMFINPFTWWFWAGGVILVLGALVAMWPTREGLESLAPGTIRFGRTTIGGVLFVVCLVPLATWHLESDTSWGSALRYEEIVQTQESGASDDPTAPDSSTPDDEVPPS
jgi:cytochrome c-type biogenesis protein CcmF